MEVANSSNSNPVSESLRKAKDKHCSKCNGKQIKGGGWAKHCKNKHPDEQDFTVCKGEEC